MLERTAGCVENAGRRIFRDSNCALRARKAPCNGLGQSFNGRSEYSQWQLAYRQPLRSRDRNKNAAGVSSDSQAPTLGFLYPSQTQEFVASCLLRSSRCFLSRRRRRGGSISCRGFASNAGLDRTVGEGQQANVKDMEGYPEEFKSQSWAKDTLMQLLKKGILRQADRAWQLYLFAGQPSELNSDLLAHYGKSENIKDHTRAKHLFDSISKESRSAEDYLNLTRSYLAAKPTPDLCDVCQEAEASGHGLSCWTLALVRSVEESRWALAQSIYAAACPVDKQKLWKGILELIKVPSIPDYLLDLSMRLDQPIIAGGSEETSPKFSKFLIDMVFSTSEALEKVTTDDLSLLLQRLYSASVLAPNQFYTCLSTLQTAKSRSAFVRSIVIYRNFRRLMDNAEYHDLSHGLTHDLLLNLFLVRLSRFQITAGIEYFLKEYASFNFKPSIRAYRHALWGLARAPDPSRVQKVFENLITDHGHPTTCEPRTPWKLLTPLLYVHATVGNVNDTLVQLEKLSKDYGLEPNIYCWNIVLTAFAKAGDLPGCFSFFKMLIERGIKLDSYTFGIPMALCARRGEIDTIHQLLEMAKQNNVTLTTPMLDTVVEAHCSNQNFKTAESFAEACLSMDVEGSRVRMWNLLLWRYAFQVDLDSISRIRSRMDSAGIEPDEMTYAALILSLVLLGQTDSARRILRTLHRSGKTHATEFHYVLVLYGYVKDRNRDMVHIIFREIQKRFKNPGLSARLLVLRSQLQRDLHLIQEAENSEEGGDDADPANVHFEHAEKFLFDAIKSFDPAKINTKQPTTGANRRRATEAFPLKYYEELMAQYAKKGAIRKVGRLLNEYAEGRGLSIEAVLKDAPLTLMEILMLAYARTDNYVEADKHWELSYRRARDLAKHSGETKWLSSLAAPSNPPGSPLPSKSGLNRQGDDDLRIKSDSQNDPLAPQEPLVLPVYRFSLSRILSYYMRTLGSRNMYSEIDQVAAEVEKSGFSLTTYNWSEYVRLFASSDDPANVLRAFAVFEEKYMPAFPGWKKLRKLQGFKHSNVPDAIDLMERHNTYKARNALGPRGWKYWRQMHPDVMQPTYVTLVYLASALLRARATSVTLGNAELRALYATAPNTIAAIAEMPRLKDKFQGMLLRQRPLRPDSVVPHREKFVWTGGILGVGGRRRSRKSIASREEPLILTSSEPSPEGTDTNKESPQPKPASSPMSPFSSDTELADPHQTDSADWSMISYEDQFDIQAQSALYARRKESGTDDEWMDDESLSRVDDESLLHVLSVDKGPDTSEAEESVKTQRMAEEPSSPEGSHQSVEEKSVGRGKQEEP